MGIRPGAVNASDLKNVLTITSPINGTVSNVFARIGSYVDVSSPVAEIVDNSQLHLDLQVFEQDLPKIRTGQLIRFTITNNPVINYTAKVFSIGSSFQNSSKTVAVHSDILGDKRGLIDGMNITANVELDNVFSTAVVNSALVSSEGKAYIFIVKNRTNGLAEGEVEFEKIEVSKGTTSLGYTAIVPVRDLPDSVQIVTNGAFFINAKMMDIGEHDH